MPRGLRARRGAADDDRRRAAVLREVSGRRESTCRAAACRRPGERFVNKDYAATLRTHRDGRRDSVLSRHRSRGASPTTWPGTAASSASTIWRSTARSSGRPLSWPVSRPQRLLGAAAGLDRRDADRNAADSPELHAASGRGVRDAMPTSCTTRSSRGGCATRVRASPIRRSGTSTSDRISIRRTRRRCSSASIRRRRTATGRAGSREEVRPSASAAGRRRSRSPMPTAT